jgi:biopolymer transport protein ExbD
MTEILATGSEYRRKAGVRRVRKEAAKPDMTPMVDLGFLLITFFIVTTRLSQPAVMKLNMPKESGDSTKVAQSNALTILLDFDDKVYYYLGDWSKAYSQNAIYHTSYSVAEGIGKVIRDRQKWLDEQGTAEGRRGLMLLIKPGEGASYRNVVDALDEVTINLVARYAITGLEREERDWMARHR